MTLQKTASKTALLLQCPRPFAADTETEIDPPGEAAIYGTRWHRCMADALQIARTFGRFSAPQFLGEDTELEDHVFQAYLALGAWCQPDGNPFGLKFEVVEVETSRALDLTKSSDGTINVKLFEEDGGHEYFAEGGLPLKPEYLAGTTDVVLEAESPTGIFRVVLDHKTGEDYANEYIHPASLPQLQALAEMWEADAVAIIHAPKLAPVQIYAEMIPRNISRFRHELWRAHRMVDSGFMRPGPECKYCPARGSCPAKQGELIAATTSLVHKTLNMPITPYDQGIDMGHFHQMLGQLGQLEKQARGLLRESVRRGEIIERPDGKVLQLSSVSVERLSKKSILEAYGKQRGEEMLQTLRDAGALKEVSEERLVAK